ncbi:MAG: EAL domain-containing response regulator [bacterium]|nr:EAL domain-containing protein [Gammaproteobacteria bacterium]HIL94881.1 EAL domain-containing protein [Pseudomonadales bacterium]
MPVNRVFIVDDDPRICRVIKRVATQLGVESQITGDPPGDFLKEISQFRPTVIFVDLQMPRIDGIQLLRFLAEAHFAAAIVLVSGMDKSVIETSEELGKSLGLNMSGILTKPIEIDEIREMLLRNFDVVEEQNRGSLEFSETELLQAIRNKELVVHYQPQIDLATNKAVGMEALARWQHPTHGLVFPDNFIPVAENSDKLIGELTYAILDSILQEDLFRRDDIHKLSISINLSARMLNDLSLPDRFEKMLLQQEFSPHQLIIEVTESGAMEDTSLTMDILTRFRIKGFRLSLDDFGTGYSSMVQLYRLPFNEIKVDKSFVMKVIASEEAASITKLTIDLGHSLGLDVVAEGVEDQQTYDWLKSLGCEIGQGYFVSRALDAENFVNWFDEYQESGSIPDFRF